jgi:TolB protein
MPGSQAGSQLWLVPASGAKATALTASPAAQGDDGDLNAWPLPAGTYVQDAGGCGYVYLARLQPSAQTTPVPVPGVPAGESTIALGSSGNDLAVQAVGACGGPSRLMWFNPAAGTVTPLLGGSANGGYTGGAVLFGEPRVS